MWCNLSGTCTLHQFCFWPSFSRDSKNIPAVCPCLYLCLKCMNMYCMIGPANLMDDVTLLLFACSNIKIDELKCPKSQLMFVKFWPLYAIPKSVSYTRNHQRRFSETFHISQKEASQGRDWIWCIFSVYWGASLHWATTITEIIQHTLNTTKC